MPFSGNHWKSEKVITAKQMLEVVQADAVFYPDVMVSCHPEDLAAERVLHHPRVIVEVLSDSTVAYDRGGKFAAYRMLESLQEYVLVDAERQSVEVFRRNPAGQWVLFPHGPGTTVELASVDLRLPMATVYEDVALQAPVKLPGNWPI